MAQIGSGEVKMKLYNMFKGRLETDIVDMVYAGCDYKVEEAISALSNMCSLPEKSVVKTEEVFPQSQLARTQYEDNEQKNEARRKTMFLLRGLPGSGKTYLANKLKQPNDVILSTDDYFTTGTGYHFQGEKLQEAHDWNLARARAAARRDDVNNIFIDNTNIRSWEMLPYVSVAKEHGYNIEILVPRSPWAWNVNELERRNTHRIKRRKLISMLERFEKGVTVDKLLRQIQPVNVYSETRQSAEPMEITHNDDVYFMANRRQTEPVDGAILIDDDMQSYDRPLQDVDRKEISENIYEEVASSVVPSQRPGVLAPVDVIDDAADALIETALASSTYEKPQHRSSVSVKKEDLQFLAECFPNYSNSDLKSLYTRFNGDMQRTCNEIMEKPLIRMTSLDEFGIDSDDYEDIVHKSGGKEAGPAQTVHEIEAKNHRQTCDCFATVLDDEFDSDNEKFILKLDRRFIYALKKYSGAASRSPIDDINEEDLVLPLSRDIAEEIVQNWEDYYKAKRKRSADDTWTEKRRKQIYSDDVRAASRNRASSPKSFNRQGPVSKPVGSSSSSSSDLQEGTKGKLQGSFRPWSAVVSGPPKDIRFLEPGKPRWELSRENPEIRLYTMFPNVKKDVLDEILVAMSYNVEAAADAVRTSLMLMPEDSITTKAESNDMIEKSVPNHRRETSIEATKGGQSSNESLSGSDRQTESSITLVDLTDSASTGYQSLSGTSYADFRAEAQAHAAIRKEWLQKAAKAYTEKHGHIASYCADQARKQGVLMKEANRRAAELIFLNKNSNQGDPVSFDFHGLHCEEAIEMLEEILEQATNNYHLKYINIITGRGAHSKGKVAKLKTSVLNYLIQQQYRYTKLNDGCFRVHLR